MTPRTFLLVFLLSFLPSLTWGKDDHTAAYFRCYYEVLNLPQTSILQIVQDRKGFLWLATGRGVYRFDGHTAVKLADILPEYRDELSGHISWLMIDEDNKLWLNNGLIYDLDKDNISRNSIPVESAYNAPLIDKRNNLWLNCDNGFVRYTNNNKDIARVEAAVGPGFSLSDYYVWGVSDDAMLYRMSVGEGDIAVLKYDLARWGIDDITVIKAITDNLILVGSSSTGLWRYEVRTQTARQIIPEEHVRDIMLYSPSVCWLATENGIYIYDVNTDEIEHWAKDSENPYAIQDHSIYSFYKDREGGVWCGSYFRGLSYVPNSQCKFNSFKPSKRYPGLKGTIVREFCKDDDGHLWIGTEDGGLNCFNIYDGTFTNYSKTTGLATNNIRGLCLVGNELWCGSTDCGIEVFNIKERAVVRSLRSTDKVCGLASDAVSSILRTPEGRLLVATDAGVQEYNTDTDSFSNVFKNIEACNQLYQDSKGHIWCVCTHALICLSPDGTSQRYDLNNATIQSVMESRNHTIWVATSSGVARLDMERGEFVPYALSDWHIPTNYAYRIIEDGLGYFWVSTAYGLVRFQPDTQSTYVFTTLEALPENRFNANSSFLDSNGILYFGTINGFISFDPTLLLPNKIVPHPALTKLTCTGKNQKHVLYGMENHDFSINYTENNVTFDFATFTYTAPDALRCRYMLTPLDKSWHVQQGHTPITYYGLSPGNYTLLLQTTDYNGEWCDNQVSYRIEIMPPFYLSWWAKTIYVLLLMGTVIFLFSLWNQRMKRKQQQHVQEMKDATEKELYHTKIKFFTTIMHEIRTPLTLIKVPLEKEMEKNHSENLQLVKKNVERLHHLCTQLLDFRKMESERLQLNFINTSLSDLLRDILFSFSAQIEDNGLAYEDNLDTVTIDAPVDREAFTKIVSNLMNNAIKYAATRIKVQLGTESDNFYLSIYNDGEKIAKEEHTKIFNMFYRTEDAKSKDGMGVGLALSRQLAEMHNGSLELVNNADITHFKLSLPLHQQLVFSIEVSKNIVEDNEQIEYVADACNDATVLIVEDEPELRAFLKDSLAETYHVVVASNGVQALELLKEVPISIIITDVMMPKMGGCELCSAVKNDIELCGIPVVMLTAKNTVQAKLDGYAAGAEEYIEKPFSMKYLHARISAILHKRKEEVQHHFQSTPVINIANLSAKSEKALVSRFCQLVNDNLNNEKLNIAFLCEQLGMSQTTFYRKLKSAMDISPNDYIRMMRVERAAAILLEVEDVRISDVAYELGFSSPSYFTRCFIQHYGMPPKEYVIQKKASKSLSTSERNF